MKKIKRQKTKAFLLASVFLLNTPYSHAAGPKSYVDCLSDMSLSQVDLDFTAEALKDANTYSERFMGKILSMLPKSLEEEIVKLAGSTMREMQNLKNQVAESGIGFMGKDLTTVNEKMQVALKSFYAYHGADGRFMVLLTPEGKVFYTKVSEKGIETEKVSKKFTLQDGKRSYFFSIYHDVKCQKNCDNYLWLVDSAPLSDQKTAVVKTADFPLLAATEVTGTEAEVLARNLWEDELKYGLAKVVGVEKAQKLPGRYLLPDPQDSSKYNKQKFASALQSCKKSVVSKQDKELLAQAIALL